MRFAPSVASLVLSLMVCSSAAASLLNGGFESGDLNGWYSSGTTAIADGSAGYAPMAGSYSALIVAMSSAPVPPYSCATDIWNWNCTQPLPFAPSGAVALTHTTTSLAVGGVPFLFLRGAYIGQDLVVQQGQRMLWDWSPFGEAVAAPTLDEARFYATNGVVEQVLDFSAGKRSFEFTQSGLWSVYFGVYQREDPYGYSAVLVDSIRVVPEPPTIALTLLSLLFLTSRRGQWKSGA